jgi:prolipoprotein diacylglyceryltransferase
MIDKSKKNSGIMKTLMIIETAHGGMFFFLTYLAAVLVAAGMTIFYGYRKGYPKSTWLLILFTGLLFFIIGEKVASYSSGQWMQVFTSFQLPETDKKTILGGIIGLFVGLILAKICLRFNRPVLDRFAVALPLSMAISRIGCLMAGCCFGTPTNLPWGIQYDSSTLVYQVHLARGLVNLHNETSLAVHPVQLYQVIGCLVIALIVWRTRKQWKTCGSHFLFSVLCYASLRFLIEFVRDPASSFILTEVFLGLKILQWLILGAILLGILILVFRESKEKSFSLGFKPIYISDLRQVFLVILLSVIVFVGRKWFDRLELLMIMLFLVPAFTAIFVNLYLKHSVAGYRWVVPVILVCSFSFMSQKSITEKKKGDKITFTDVGIVGMFGKYSEELQEVKVNCDNYSYQTIATQSVPFYQTGLNFSYNIWQGRYNKHSFGARLFYGNEYPDQTTSSSKSPVIGISPYASLNWKWLGFTYGFSVGQMKIPIGEKESELHDGEIVSKDKTWFGFIPSLSVSLGPSDIFFAEGSYASGLFPYSSPFSSFRTGIGTGFGKSDGTSAMIGLCGLALYLKMVYPIKNKFVVEAFYADNFSTGSHASRTLSLGFTYRILTTDKYKEQLKAPSMTYNSLVNSTSSSVKKLNDKVTDFDGNGYSTIALGGQVWMAENLKVTHYRDGSEIPDATREVQGSGRQYNWHAVNSRKNLCPAGWHVPSLAEWTSLINSLGGKDAAGSKLEKGFSSEGKVYHWWSFTEVDSLNANSFYLNNQTIGVMFTTEVKNSFLSVRCSKDF